MTAATVLPRPVRRVSRTPNGMSPGGWRVATRLARREVRRRWGRTLLVMFLVAVPVFGMTAITTLERTARTAPAREFVHEFGSASLAGIDAAPPPGSWPAGTQIVRGREVDAVGVLAAGGAARVVEVTDVDLTSPVTAGAVLLRSGRFPRVAGEALVSPNVARAFHVGVGDVLRLSDPGWTERVVGIGVTASNWSNGLIAVRGNELSSAQLQVVGDQVQQLTLARLPGKPSAAQLQRYAPAYLSASTIAGDSAQRAVNWTLVAGMIALAISGVVISGAFAVGARRQLVTLGQLSANGADETLLRRTLSLQGAWSGAFGVVAGIAAGVVTLILLHARLNGWIHRDIGPLVWSTRDLVAIAITGVVASTIAAFFPARSAARVPVLSALAGRRPLGALPASIVPIGFALFGGGVLVLALVAAASHDGGGDGLALAAVLGGLLVLAGACCVSPAVVASLVHLGARVRGAGRVAVRSLVRTRARSAAVVMALAAINAGAIAMATAVASRTEPIQLASPFMPDNTIVLVRHSIPTTPGEPTTFLPITPTVEHLLRTILPNATWQQRRAVDGTIGDVNKDVNKTVGPGTQGPTASLGDGKRVAVLGGSDEFVVADPAVLQLVGLSHADATTLQRVGVVVLDRPGASSSSSAPVNITVGSGVAAQTVSAPVARHRVHASAGIAVLITPAEAQRLHAPIESAGVIITNGTRLDETQRASIDALQPTIMFGATSGPATSTDITELLWAGPRSTGISPDAVRQIFLAVVVLIALVVLAISLALSAAETRDERDVLVSLGARPATMRGVAAWKAATLAFTGAALAIPTGFIPVAVAFVAAARAGEHARVAFPWSTTLELLIIAPLIAAVVTAIGSSIAQHFRPTQMSTFATD